MARCGAAAVKEHAVVGRVAGNGSARAVDVDLFERGAPVKGAFGYVCDRIGDVDYFKRAAVAERRCRDLGYGSALVACGDRHGVGGVYARARAHGVVARFKRKGESFVYPEGINFYVVRRVVPRCKRVAVGVGELPALAVWRAEPAAEYARADVVFGNVEYEVLFVGDRRGGEFADVVAGVLNGVFPRLIVGVEHKFARAGKERAAVYRAVACRACGRVVPCRKLVAGHAACSGCAELVAGGFVQRYAVVPAAVERYGKCVYFYGGGVGGDILCIGEYDAYLVYALFGEPVFKLVARGAVGYRGNGRAVQRHGVAHGARNGLPADSSVLVGEGGLRNVVYKGETFGKGGSPVLFNFELHGVFARARPGDPGYGAQVNGALVCGNGCLFIVVDYLVACAVFCRPAERGAGKAYVGGNGGGGLFIAYGVGFGGVVSACNGGYGNGIFLCAHVFEREAVISDVICLFAYFYGVVCGAFNVVPNYDVVFYVKVGHLVQAAVKNKRGGRGSVSFCVCLYNKLDAALLHIAVCKVEVARSAVVKCGVVVQRVAAFHRHGIPFGTLHGAVYERVGFHYPHAGDPCKGVVCVVAHGCFGYGDAAGGFGGKLYPVYAGLIDER